MVLNCPVSNAISKPAQTIVPISSLIANRWSPRVFDITHELTHGDVLALAEAARWAPSSNNAQPWKFSILLRGSDEFETISQSGLTGFNQSWAPSSSAYVVVMADRLRPDGNEWDKGTVFYNAGLASAQVVFESEAMGLKAHYMGGIVHDEVQKVLGVDGVWIVNILAIGKQGDISSAPSELQERELAERSRKELSEIIVHGLVR
ncbi:MAG: oxidoreductase [Actinobacteria bacterium]|nr:oxidoreductase [Actinomycetota bacterium]